MRLRLLLLLQLLVFPLFGVEVKKVRELFSQEKPPFSYPLDITVWEGCSSNQNVILCCHGYGSDASIAEVIHSYGVVNDHLIGFNFPDYAIYQRNIHPTQITYGTINELLPALYLLKRLAVDGEVTTLSLYGMSCGGGAVVNIVAVLNGNRFAADLAKVGIGPIEKEKILAALQRGVILLDVPLKSMEEIEKVPTLRSERYRENDLRPIDSLAKWRGLQLNVILFFQKGDTSLTNRDDALFIERLRTYNPNGKNVVIEKDEGGHFGFHTSLWQAYQNF